MTKTAEKLKSDLEKLQNSLLTKIAEFQEIKENNLDLSNSELVDTGYLLREVSKLYDQLRKEANRALKQVDKTIGIRVLKRNLKNPSELSDKLKGTLATGTSRVHQQPALPKRGTSEFKELLDELGIKTDCKAVDLHWPTLSEMLTENIESGGNGFRSIDSSKVFKEIKVTYRKLSNKESDD